MLSFLTLFAGATGARQSMQGSVSAADSLDVVVHLPVHIGVGFIEWDDVILHRDSDGVRDGRVHAQGLANDGVEVRQRHELVHRRVLGRHAPELLAQLLLHVRRLAEREETPRCAVASRLVSRHKESHDEDF